MGTKMKGLMKGLKYISQIFDEEKDQDIQIGFPTDVKHVAHIGWDGPSTVDSSPSWMKEFDAPSQFQSAPLGMIGGPRENPEEGSHRSTRSEGCPSPARDLPDLPKSSRHRHPSMDNSLGSETSGRDSSTKTRHSRRHHTSKEHSNRGSHRSDDPNQPPDSPTSSKQLPDIPKKSRRKKSKDCVGGGSSRSSSRSSSKANNSSNDASFSSQFSDLGSGPDSGLLAGPETNKENNQTPFVQE